MTRNDNAIDDTDDAAYSSNEPIPGRYGSFTADGELVVYDRENSERWIQSDVGVALEEAR